MINIIKSKKLNDEKYLILASGIISNDLYVVAILDTNNITINDFDKTKKNLLFTNNLEEAIDYYNEQFA